MARRRRAYHHGDLAHALLEAAEKLVERQGLMAFSLREAAREVGVDPAACYRHFANREALLDELAKRGFAELGQLMETVAAKHRLVGAQLRAMAVTYVEFAHAHPAKFRTMFGARGIDVRVPIEGQPSAYGLLERLLAEWRPTASRAKVTRDAVTLWSSVHGLACLSLEGAVTFSVAERHQQTTALIDAVLAGLTAEH